MYGVDSADNSSIMIASHDKVLTDPKSQKVRSSTWQVMMRLVWLLYLVRLHFLEV